MSHVLYSLELQARKSARGIFKGSCFGNTVLQDNPCRRFAEFCGQKSKFGGRGNA